MRNNILYLTSLILFYSCSSHPGLEFPVTENCTTREVAADLRLRVPGDLIVLDSLFIVLDPLSSDFALKVYDNFSGEHLFSGAKIGNGPLEVTTPVSIYENEGIHLFDVGKQKIVHYVINPENTGILPVSEHYLPSSEFFSYALYLNDDRYIVYPENGKGLVSFIDLASNRESIIVNNYLEKVDEEIVRNQLVGSYKLDDSGKFLVFASYGTPYVSLYENNDEGYDKVFEVFISEPEYTFSNGVFQWNEEQNVVGFMDLAIGKGRIFLLHSNLKSGMVKGRSIVAIPKIMYEFDYSGNPVKLYHLDRRILRLTMDPHGSLFGIGLDEQETDFTIVQLMI